MTKLELYLISNPLTSFMSSLVKALVWFLQRVGRVGLEATVSLIHWFPAGDTGVSSPNNCTQGSRMPAKESRDPRAHKEVGASWWHLGRTLLTPPACHWAVRMVQMCSVHSEGLHMDKGGLLLSPGPRGLTLSNTRQLCNRFHSSPESGAVPGPCSHPSEPGWIRQKHQNNPRPHPDLAVGPSLLQSKIRHSAPESPLPSLQSKNTWEGRK